MNSASSNPAFDREATLALLEFASDLPSLPDRFVKIQEVIEDPHSDADDLADIIRTDQATSVMVLKFANSPAYNPTHTPIVELQQAIARLGSRETANIASAMSLMYGMILPTGMSNIRAFWGHAFAVAIICEQMSRIIDPAEKKHTHQMAYMTGLLHDIGRAALGMRVDLAYFERDTGHLNGDPLIDAELAYYGVDHGEAGMHLLKLWNLPDDLCLAVGEHHATTTHLQLGSFCRAADQYVHQHMPPRTPFDSIPVLLKEILAAHPIEKDAASGKPAV